MQNNTKKYKITKIHKMENKNTKQKKTQYDYEKTLSPVIRE